MQHGNISAWVAIAGFIVLAAGLGLEGVALYAAYDDPGFGNTSNDRRSPDRPEPMTRFLFDRSG
jgi:hypothetical protein